MTQACVILKNSDYTIMEIADRLGYKNAESFIRIFEKVMKVSPTQHRRKHQRKHLKSHLPLG